jgi:hypothetical protein
MSLMFKIDYNKLVMWLIPEALQFPVIVAWVKALTAPIDVLYKNFETYQDSITEKLSHNSQVCYLERILNTKFDPDLRRIYIKDGTQFGKLYIYTEPELKPKYLYNASENKPLYVRKTEEYKGGADFIVVFPAALSGTNKFAIRALVDYYKLASKRYFIEYE